MNWCHTEGYRPTVPNMPEIAEEIKPLKFKKRPIDGGPILKQHWLNMCRILLQEHSEHVGLRHQFLW